MNNIKEEGNMIINFYFSHESEHARVSANSCQIKIGDFVSHLHEQIRIIKIARLDRA